MVGRTRFPSCERLTSVGSGGSIEMNWRTNAACGYRQRDLQPLSRPLTEGPRFDEHPGMALPFLYRAFCRVLQLIRLSCLEHSTPAVEGVILRHEVAVLRRQVYRPAPQLAGRLSPQEPMRSSSSSHRRAATPLQLRFVGPTAGPSNEPTSWAASSANTA